MITHLSKSHHQKPDEIVIMLSLFEDCLIKRKFHLWSSKYVKSFDDIGLVSDGSFASQSQSSKQMNVEYIKAGDDENLL